MKVVVQGSRTFDDYSVFLRSMAVALSSLKGEDKQITIYTVGPRKVNNFVVGFVNLSEDGMNNRGMKISCYKVSPDWIESKLSEIDYFIYLSNPGERNSRLAQLADKKEIELGVFRY